MSFVRPTLLELATRVQQDFVSRLVLTGAVLRRSMVYVLARVIAGAVHMLHGHLEYISKQPFADLADETSLLRMGRLYSLERLAADFATGSVVVTGVNGTDIPADTVLVRSDGTTYTVDDLATISGGEATVTVTATVAAEDGNCDADTVLTFESPIDDVDTEATVDTGGLTGGADVEDLEDYRTRLVARIQSPPHGGNDEDFIAWAKTVSGVTRVWIRRQELGPGTVLAYFVRDDDVSIIPSVGEVAEVQAVFDEEAPSHCTPTAAAPSSLALNFTIQDHGDDSAHDAVEEELADLILRTAEPGETIELEYLQAAISSADDGLAYTMTVPAANPAPTSSQLLTLGTVTWI